MGDFTQEQFADMLLKVLGGVSRKETTPKKFHPDLGWVPAAKDTLGLASETPSSIWGHGPGGLFSSPALERPVFSALLLPRQGVLSMLPTYPTVTMNPLHGIFTGVTATTGDEPDGLCDDPPTAGLAKLCMHTFVFGLQGRQTRTFDIRRAGQLSDRGEHLDLQFLGNPFQPQVETVPTVPGGMSATEMLNNDRVKAAFELAVAWSRDFAREVYTGNPANNSAGGGRQYYYGLDILINTGYRDAITGVACPAADSLVESFGNVDFTNDVGGANALVRRMTSFYHRLRYIAQNAGLMPVQWAIAMTPTAFYEMVQIWPWAYNTLYGQSVYNGQSNISVHITGTEMMQQRDAMLGDWEARTGQYLMIDGVKIPVILDDAIAETQGAGGNFTSAIYWIPFSVLGGTKTIYLEYLNWDAPNGAREFGQALAPNFFNTSDGGRFIWHYKPPVNFCVQMLASTAPRIILTTPHIAGRLTNIRYTPLAHVRSPFTDDSSFYKDGGGTNLNGYDTDKVSYYVPTEDELRVVRLGQ